MIDSRQDYPKGTGKAALGIKTWPGVPEEGTARVGQSLPPSETAAARAAGGCAVAAVQLLGHVRLFVTPWTAAHQASLSSTMMIKLMSTESVVPSNHLILTHTQLVSGERQRLPGAGRANPI